MDVPFIFPEGLDHGRNAGNTMDNKFLESGKIINTHGVRGEIKIDPWADSPEFLTEIETYYIEGKAYPVLRARVHQRFVIAQLEGVNSLDDAERLKNKILYIDRDDAELEDDEYFLTDLIGFTAVSEKDGNVLGRVTDILTLPGGDVCEIKGEREILVPLRPEFITGRDMESGTLTISLIEGM